MNKYLTAIALTIALPAMATAQTATAGCCAKMKDMAGCKDMAKMDHGKHDMKAGTDPHAGHAMPKPTVKSPPADAHLNHK